MANGMMSPECACYIVRKNTFRIYNGGLRGGGGGGGGRLAPQKQNIFFFKNQTKWRLFLYLFF